jgi:hypothetical protein
MPFRHLASLLLIVALAAGLATVPAQAQSETVAQSAAAKKQPAKHRTAKRQRPMHQVACTVFGCHPIPAGCHPETGYDWDGLPTGFDVVVCR